MPDVVESPKPPAEDEADYDALLDGFHRAWASGTRPSVLAYLRACPRGMASDPEFAFHLLSIDLEHRLAARDLAPLIEDYMALAEFRTLGVDHWMHLARQEFEGRWGRGDTSVSRDDYRIRFSEFAADFNAWSPRWSCPSCRRENIPLADEAHEQATCPRCGTKFPVELLFRPAPALDTRDYPRGQAIGEGGMGQVFQTRDPVLDRELAVKVIHEKYRWNREFERRFLREAQITGRLQHPGIVPVHSLGRLPDGYPYYTMRLVRGESLKEAIARFHSLDGPAPETSERNRAFHALLRRFLDVCNAMAYAHSRGVLHRDIKPSNIMLGPYGETLVVDWGLAKHVDQNDPSTDTAVGAEDPCPAARTGWGTLPGSMVGTPGFMSPEQAAGKLNLGPATDVYSLGATLYYLLTGRSPFEGDQTDAGSEKGQKGEFLRPRSARPDVPRPLEAVCLKAMALHPEDRYASARDLADEIERWLAGGPVSAYPEPWVIRLRRWMGRHRTLVSSVAAATIIAVVGLSVTSLLLADANRRERSQKKRAESAEMQAIAEAKHTREEARKAKELSDFMVRLFQSGDPLGLEGQGFRTPTERGRDITAAELLRRGASMVDQKKPEGEEEKLVHATLLDAIGNSLTSLGDVSRARKLVEDGLRIRRGSLSADAPEVGESLYHLAILDHYARDFAVAESGYREAIHITEASRGQSDLSVVSMKFRLAWLLAEARRARESQRLFREVLNTREAQLNPAHPELQIARLGLIVSLLETGDQIALLKEAATLDLHGDPLPMTVLTYQQAMWLRRSRNYREAKKRYEQVLSTARKALPPQHPLLGLMLGDTAGLYREMGDLVRAEALIREALEIGRKTFPTHPGMIEALVEFAEMLAGQGRTEEAERLYEEAVGYTRKWGQVDASDPALKKTLEKLIHFATSRGRYVEVEAWKTMLKKGTEQPGSRSRR
jgi:serine/threonine protein kinase/tetratricopeptide (TPR) repeat protein